jgi:hypothetical protein
VGGGVGLFDPVGRGTAEVLRRERHCNAHGEEGDVRLGITRGVVVWCGVRRELLLSHLSITGFITYT